MFFFFEFSIRQPHFACFKVNSSRKTGSFCFPKWDHLSFCGRMRVKFVLAKVIVSANTILVSKTLGTLVQSYVSTYGYFVSEEKYVVFLLADENVRKSCQ